MYTLREICHERLGFVSNLIHHAQCSICTTRAAAASKIQIPVRRHKQLTPFRTLDHQRYDG